MTKAFITFEGGDGAGKTTLIQRLALALEERGHEILHTRAPGGTPPGKVIRQLLLHPPDDPLVSRAELLLFLADRAQQVEKVILPALQAGKVVLCDRYNDSTIAYQGKARGFDLSLVKTFCIFATQELKPDLTLYLDVDPKIGLARVKRENGRADQIEKEDIAFHEKIRQTYHDLAEEEPGRIQILDGAQSPENVFEQAMHQLDARLFSRSH